MEMRNLIFGVIFLFYFSGNPLIDVKYLALETLTEEINTRHFDEIAPCVSPDGQTLYFTRVGYPVFEKTLIEGGTNISEIYSGREYDQYLSNIYSILAGEKIKNPIKSAYNQDIWVARSINIEFDKIEHPGFPLNNALPNSVSTIDPTNQDLIVINQFVEGGGMRKGFSKIGRDDNGNWTFPEPIEINNYHNSGPDVNVTMSRDGKVMIMSLERDDSYGKSDLYVSFKTANGNWTTPRNLGRKVNSLFREATPHLSEDMRTLYFSSNRGRKGSDIFVQTRLDDTWGNWSAPKKFTSPINSSADDSHPYFNEATGYLYFTSKRNGSSDIFRVQITKAKPKGLMVKTKIRDAKTKNILNVKVIVKKDNYTESLKTYHGILNLNLTESEKCTIIIEKEGYFDFQKEISLDEALLAKNGEYNLSLDLKRIETGFSFILEAIQFKQSEAIVLQESYPSLDKLYRFLKRNSTIQIQIAGHTDNVGDKKALLWLSEDRADTIKNYLVEKGIDPSRLQTIGYGGNFPLNNNSSEKLKSKNRRVEIIVSNDGVTSLKSDPQK
jgi:outer membrane protein OmpA-like peptidoglycan-associated protein/Tol biopolymer transport system component